MSLGHLQLFFVLEESSEVLTKCQLWLTAVKLFPETVATLGVCKLTDYMLVEINYISLCTCMVPFLSTSMYVITH